MVSGNAWKSIQDIRKGISNSAGLQFDYRVNSQCDERGLKGKMLNATKVTIEVERN